MARIIVFHSEYGCETGCCGHTIEFESESGSTFKSHFSFSHPYHPDDKDSPRAWAEKLVAAEFGEEHVQDLDWDNCVISND